MNYNKIKIDYNKNFVPLKITNLNELILRKLFDQEIDPSYSIKLSDGINYTDTKILSIKRTESTWKEVYNLKLDSRVDFVPGDSIGLLCPNNIKLADQIFNLLGIPNDFYYIKQIGRSGFEYKGSLRDFFIHIFDFTSLPKKSFLYDISKKSPYRSQIEYLCSKEGTADYLSMIKRWNNVIDFILTFECKISLEDLLMNCQTVKPRYYSLTNSIKDKCSILVGTISKEINGIIRYGHVSDFVHNGHTKDLKICLRVSNLIRIGNSLKILCICTGTGVAPFLSFMKNKKEDQKLKIIYGFRNVEDDLTHNEKLSTNTEIIKVLSSTKMYVTDYIDKNQKYIEEFVREDCLVYVCGRSEMQKRIFEIFSERYNYLVEDKRLFFDSWL
jgi:methionine synthase reductase